MEVGRRGQHLQFGGLPEVASQGYEMDNGVPHGLGETTMGAEVTRTDHSCLKQNRVREKIERKLL